ncbi:hypothetical protein D3C72_897900 [compost metagenome]
MVGRLHSEGCRRSTGAAHDVIGIDEPAAHHPVPDLDHPDRGGGGRLPDRGVQHHLRRGGDAAAVAGSDLGGGEDRRDPADRLCQRHRRLPVRDPGAGRGRGLL